MSIMPLDVARAPTRQYASVAELETEARQSITLVASLGGRLAVAYARDDYVQARFGAVVDPTAERPNSYTDYPNYDPRETPGPEQDTLDGYLHPSYFEDNTLAERMAIHTHYDKLGLPAELFTLLGLDDSQAGFLDIIDTLYKRDASGSYIVSSTVFKQALVHIAATHAKEQADFDKHAGRRYKNRLRKRLHTLTRNSTQFPQYLRQRFQTRIARTRVLVDDGFGTVLSTDKLTGSHDFTYERTIISRYASDPFDVYAHEAGHMLEGRPIAEGSNRRGITRAFPTHPLLGKALQEAGATVFASAIKYSEFVNPKSSHNVLSDERTSYFEQRQIVKALCVAGIKNVPLERFTESIYVEGKSAASQAFMTMHLAIAAAFPDHPDLYNDLEAILSKNPRLNTFTKDTENKLHSYLEGLAAHYKARRTFVQKLVKLCSNTAMFFKEVFPVLNYKNTQVLGEFALSLFGKK